MMSSSDQPDPAKTIKPASTDGGEVLIRGEPWFDDGNIVLQAENTQWRIYRGILSASSSVFADMFAIPQPATGEDLVDGCPVVAVTDSAQDWKCVLDTLYERRFDADRRDMRLSNIAAFLRLGQKYDIEFISAEGITRLVYEYPSTLQKFDAVRDQFTLIQAIGVEYSVDGEVIALAQADSTPNLERVLPSAFYSLCGRDDFKEVFGDFGQSDVRYPNNVRKAYVLGWKALIEAQADTTFSWLQCVNSSASSSCISRSTCNSAKQALKIELFLPTPKCMALAIWQSYWERNMCSPCVTAAQQSHRQGRQKIWNALPGYFGLPSWDELLK